MPRRFLARTFSFPKSLLAPLCLFALACPLFAQTTAPSSVAPPEPEDYLADSRYLQYSQAAESYLDAHADSPAASRVAMDLLVTATVFDDQVAAARMFKLILSTYPASPQAKYVVGVMSEASQFTGVINAIADDNFETMPAGFAGRFDAAMRLGVARFGEAALGGGPSLARTAILAHQAGDGQILQAVIQLLNNSGIAGEPARKVLVITDDDTKPAVDRLVALHALDDRAVAIPFERYLMHQLSDADRMTPQIIKIQADDLLESGRLADALPLLDKLSAGADARELFWFAWSTAANGNTAAAGTIFATLKRKFPNDPWAKEADQFAPAVADLDSTLARHAEAALAASRSLKDGTDVLEANADYVRTDGQKINLYVGIETGKLLELLVKKVSETGAGGDTTMAYRATDQDASIFVQGAPKVGRFAKPALLPIPIVGLAHQGTDFNFGVSMRFSYSFDDLQTAMGNLLDSDYLSTREGLQDFLRSFTHRGIFPLPPAPGANGSTVYEWISPAVSSPTVSRVLITTAGDGAIISMQAGNFNLTSIRYGKAGAFSPNPPALPNLPIADTGQMTTGILQQAVPLFVSQFSPPPPPPATQPATQPAAAPAAAPAAK